MICSECIACYICHAGRDGPQCKDFLMRIEALKNSSAERALPDVNQIISDAVSKHNIDIKLPPSQSTVELVQYSLHVGFNAGYTEAVNESKN